MTGYRDDITIARETPLLPIEQVAVKAGFNVNSLYRYGPYKAKIAMEAALPPTSSASGKYVLVTAISPTTAGEGKTTTTIGLGDALTKLGQKTLICLREPSLGPCFGMKGGATGGGLAQVAPMDEINLHFTGDFHAITAANNLLAAMIDNHIYWGNELRIDPTKVTWRRVMDMNDRALRKIVVGLDNNGQVREDGFDITVASEVMAIFCLAKDLTDLEERLGNIIIGQRFDKSFVRARELKAAPAMAALLRDAFQPNIVQTLEHTPTLIHGGPFANIAHGCNTVVASRLALSHADIVVTEAGFGADLGAEKFLNIKCRQSGLAPDAIVIVATVRALKMHGGVAKDRLGEENIAAVCAGTANLVCHIENMKKFGVPVVVAINQFSTDTQAEMNVIHQACEERGIRAHFCNHWGLGGAGALTLAQDVVDMLKNGSANFKLLYPDMLPLREKIQTVAREIYRAKDVDFAPAALRKLALYEKEGYGKFPVCMAKTQYSFSANPKLLGAPKGHVLPVRDVRLSAGAGFVVALCGEIMTMPGLGRSPAAERIHINRNGLIDGLF
ncbi:MAG: formate--tetrahydrofolate ligase [Proteobacteria bacterium]|jgi:formate--tetrahydrofolate ligase|nr:formate--tetrahydrofolate ligase [Alphaproteobacteria bacterium]NCC02931.1 formate--tetrahydrofolate ligase [Pseudomonadota bacterium]